MLFILNYECFKTKLIDIDQITSYSYTLKSRVNTKTKRILDTSTNNTIYFYTNVFAK